MRRRLVALVLAALGPAGLAGCMNQPSARYIYQDGEFGVIGIPENSPFGRRDYRKQAELLMSMHFPEGHEIVRAEEVVEGQRVLDKSRTRAFETDPAISALSQKIDLGKLAQTTTTQTKDSLPILESRIIYKRKGPPLASAYRGYSEVATVGPELYLDPNEMARCREKIEMAELKTKHDAALAAKDKDRAKDPETKQASLDATKAGAASQASPQAAKVE